MKNFASRLIFEFYFRQRWTNGADVANSNAEGDDEEEKQTKVKSKSNSHVYNSHNKEGMHYLNGIKNKFVELLVLCF